MTREELRTQATAAGVEWSTKDTKADLVEKIAAATGDNSLLADPGNMAPDVGEFQTDSWHPAQLDPSTDDNGALSYTADEDGPQGMWMHRVDPDDGVIFTPAENIARAPAQDDEAVYMHHAGMHEQADALPEYNPHEHLRPENGAPVDSGDFLEGEDAATPDPRIPFVEDESSFVALEEPEGADVGDEGSEADDGAPEAQEEQGDESPADEDASTEPVDESTPEQDASPVEEDTSGPEPDQSPAEGDQSPTDG